MGERRGRRNSTPGSEEENYRASQAQKKSLWEARMFELGLPSDIQYKINEEEENLWEELDRDTLHDECLKVEDWVLDSSDNAGRLSLYE